MTETLLDQLVVQVRADTTGVRRELSALEASLDTGLAAGFEAAGRRMEGALNRFIRTGKFGFEDLRRLALQVLSDIAAAQIRASLREIGSGGSGGGLFGGILAGALGLLGGPGRATGGPVTAGRPYRVGEAGPEWFVPASDGRVVAHSQVGGSRSVHIAINVAAPADASSRTMQQSARQVARAVRRALEQAEQPL